MRLSDRVLALERTVNTKPLMVVHIDGTPTPEQQSVIDRSARTGQRLFVHCRSTGAAWMPGLPGTPPWGDAHANH